MSGKSKNELERGISLAAIMAFILHFSLLFLVNWGVIPEDMTNQTPLNPISAIYTPFSIILLYEIYSLIYYLPKSISIYLGKQYEIIALIIIRKLFYDLSNIPVGIDAFGFEHVDELFLSFGGLLLLYFLIFVFYRLSGARKYTRVDETQCRTIQERNFVISKKVLAMALMVVFIVLFVKSLFELDEMTFSISGVVDAIKTINYTFFSTFFTVLILTDVLLLLLTFNLTSRFEKVMRNSGFIISTILLKLSFMTTGLWSIAIILAAVVFGILILWIYRLYQKKLEDGR